MSEDARFAYSGLDRVLHAPARLSILTALMAADEGISFNALQAVCDLTPGNLSNHVKPLEEAGLIRPVRTIEFFRAVTRYEITESGRTRFLAYLDVLQSVIRDATRSASPASGAKSGAVGASI